MRASALPSLSTSVSVFGVPNIFFFFKFYNKMAKDIANLGLGLF